MYGAPYSVWVGTTKWEEKKISVIITGDCHGDFRSLGSPVIRRLCDDEQPSTVAIMGDAGAIFSTNPKDSAELYWLNWLDKKPWITVATLGNHEGYERIYQLPLVDLFGGKAYKVSEKFYYLKHGEIYTIDGKTILNFGGANSIDKAWRKDRITWWQEEIPTQADYMHAVENLAKVGNKVDYIWSHTAPTDVINLMNDAGLLPFGGLKLEDPTCAILDTFEKTVEFKKWCFGHFHVDRPRLTPKFCALYSQPYLLDRL